MKNNFLSDTKMGQLVARLLGKSELTVKDGKVVLSEDERNLIEKNYGAGFLKQLEETSLEDEDGNSSARSLFDAAVAHHTSGLMAQLKDKDSTIAKLQKDIEVLCAMPEPHPGATPAGKQTAQSVTKVNMSAKHNAFAKSFLENPSAVAFAQLADGGKSLVDVSQVNSEFGEVLPPNARLELLSKGIYLGFADAKHMTRVQSNTDYKGAEGIFTEVSQQFTDAWTPKGTMKFTPCEIKYRRHKVNVQIRPASIVKSWLVSLYEQGTSIEQKPITKYIIENHLLPKILDDITRSMIAKGKFVDAGTKNDGDEAPAAKNSMDGFETILAEGLADSNCKMNFFKDAKNLNDLSDKELFDYINQFAEAISSYFKIMHIYCAPSVYQRYCRVEFDLYGKYSGKENKTGKIRFTSESLVPMESMYGSPILFATPKENFVMLVDYSKAENCIESMEKNHYTLDIIGEYSLATGFKVAEAVFASVPAGYTPVDAVVTDGVLNPDKWTNGGAGAVAVAEEGDEVEGA